MKSWIRDIFITLLLLSVFAWAGLEFYRDLHSQITNEGGEVIGEITFIENGAQRKFADRAVWGDLETSTPLYNYDSLRTIEDSRATIRLIDGTEISLASNTYIVLEWGEESQNIEFLGGNISAERKGEGTSTLRIKAEDTVIALDTATVTLDKKEGDSINLSVDEGTIDVTVGDKTQSIEKNFRASIQDDIRVEQEAVTLKSPANNRLLVTTAATVPIRFEWEQSLDLENMTLEVAEFQDFRSAERLIPEGNQSFLTRETLPGTYFWRIRGSYGDGNPYFSSANRVVLIRDNSPSLQVPAMDEVFQYRRTLPDLAFSWENSGLTNTTRLQIATDAAFSNLVTDISSSNNFYTQREIPGGDYFWRVIPEYNTASKISYTPPEIRRFRVEYDETVDPPELILPADKEEINPLKVREGLRFSWLADKEISTYHLLVSRDPEMREPLVDEWINRNSYLEEEMPEQGRYFWQVDGLDRENQPVPPSEIRDFTILAARIYITPDKPAPGSLQITESYDSTLFSWDSSLQGPFEVQIFREDNTLVPLLTKRTEPPSATLPLPGEGNYYWQVSVLNEEGLVDIISEQVPFTMVDKLGKPVIQTPQENQSFSLLGDNPLKIQWIPIPDAAYYNAQLVPENPNDPTLRKQGTTEPVWLIEDKARLRAGNYTLSVEAFQPIDEELINQSGVSLRKFTLDRVQSYSRPVLTYPVPGRNLSRMTILEQSPSFRWTQSPPLPKQQIRLSRSADFATTLLDEELTVQNRPIPDLTPGTYYLQILSRDAQDNPAPPSELYSFEVTPVPALPDPSILEPVSGAVLDMQNRDYLTFRWSPSRGAGYYDLKLISEATGNLIIHQEKATGSQYNFSRLEDLDVGFFRVEIRAIREREGEVFQQSSLQTRTFELTLPEITEVPEILSPELQYVQ